MTFFQRKEQDKKRGKAILEALWRKDNSLVMNNSEGATRPHLERLRCEQWLADPLVNPETGHPIIRNGPTFNEWLERCRRLGFGRPKPTRKMTWQKCQEWRRNPEINPDTGHKIKIDGPMYKNIAAQCDLIKEKERVILGDYFVPDQRGLVPCVQNDKGRWYVVRRHGDQQIWGPLNLPVRRVQLRYYADTWDYTHGYFRPVYLGGRPEPPIEPVNYTTPEAKKNPKYVVDNVFRFFIRDEM